MRLGNASESGAGSTTIPSATPFVIMAVSLPMRAVLLAEGGINTDFLAPMQPDTEIPFLNMEMAIHNCAQIAKVFWNHPIGDKISRLVRNEAESGKATGL